MDDRLKKYTVALQKVEEAIGKMPMSKKMLDEQLEEARLLQDKDKIIAIHSVKGELHRQELALLDQRKRLMERIYAVRLEI